MLYTAVSVVCAVYVGNRAMPTLINSYRNVIEVPSHPSKQYCSSHMLCS